VYGSPTARALYESQVSITTLDDGMYWRPIEPQRGVFDFAKLDRDLASARAAGLRVRGHPLVYPTTVLRQMPAWLADQTFSKRELTDILVTHVERIVDHFKGRIDEWVVVNEPYLPTYGYPRYDIFYEVIGEEYIDLAFATARRIDPAARLILNHNDNDHATGIVEQMRRVAWRLRDKGLLDAVGLEMYEIDMDWVPGGIPTAEDVAATIRSYEMPCVVTEFNYDLSNYPGTKTEKYARQADIYRRLFGAFLDAGVKEISFSCLYRWDFESDQLDPEMFDADLKPKPAYFAVRDLFKKRAGLA
jgi:endo-1,4-beta-xylanase